jgi:hypothetical protein
LEGSGSTDSENLDRFQSIQAQLQQFEQERAEMVEQLQSLRDRLEDLDAIPQQLQDLSSTSSAIAEQLNSNGDRAGNRQTNTKKDKKVDPDIEIPSVHPNNITSWLGSQNIHILQYRKPQSRKRPLNKLSWFMGENYNNIMPIYKSIKSCISNNQSNLFKVQLSSNNREISFSTSLCQNLKYKNMLVKYEYQKSQRIIQGQVAQTSKSFNFLTGEWFERFVYFKAINVLKENQIKYNAALNIEIQSDLIDKHELDILFHINNLPLWIECKTGQFSHEDIERYSQLAQQLLIPKKRAFLIVLDIQNNQINQFKDLDCITVTNLSDFLNRLKQDCKK